MLAAAARNSKTGIPNHILQAMVRQLSEWCHFLGLNYREECGI